MASPGTASSPVQPWPPELAGTPAIGVIEQAIVRQRLGHSLLLHGDSLDTLVSVAHAIADRLLNPAGAPADSRRAVGAGSHPDCFLLRPSGKMRVITADATRELIGQVQMSARVGSRKVAIIHEADRMNASAANIFLKTLEEPPAHTTLLLLTTHPYALLATIRSRCLHFKFGATVGEAAGLAPLPQTHDPESPPTTPTLWSSWLADYRGWLAAIPAAGADKRAVGDLVFTLYGLVARFGFILDKAAGEAWERQKAFLPPDLDEDEQTAIEIGLANGLRARFFAEIEDSTRLHARSLLFGGENPGRRAFTAAVEQLERNAGLLRVNLNESAALEDFLLASLRLWSGR